MSRLVQRLVRTQEDYILVTTGMHLYSPHQVQEVEPHPTLQCASRSEIPTVSTACKPQFKTQEKATPTPQGNQKVKVVYKCSFQTRERELFVHYQDKIKFSRKGVNLKIIIVSEG